MLHMNRQDFLAVEHVSFAVERGEIFGIIGENGSGKSTLIRMISTLLYPSSGSISVFGFDVRRDYRKVRSLINRVSVEAAFFKKLSARENLLFAGRLYGVDRANILRSMVTILERVNFPIEKLDDSMEDLSRGMQQKVAIARSLLTAPNLLLLDEPTTGLDPRSKKEVQCCIDEIRSSHDATVLITTHDMTEAETLCDRLAIINEGKFVAVDTPSNLKKRTSTEHPERVTLEEVFMQMTGRRYGDDDENDST
ncbi:ABC transporter ATP-binding protein [bacterium]|nr:ABC transporter ATP-binding protein [bacterium]